MRLPLLIILVSLAVLLTAFSACNTEKQTHIYGEVYEWVDATSNAKSWIFVNSSSNLNDEEYYKVQKLGKTLIPLEGVEINFRHLDGNFPPSKILTLTSSIEGTFDSGNVLLENPDIIEVNKNGYYNMSLETDNLDAKPILIIMVKSESSSTAISTSDFDILFETYVNQEHQIYLLKAGNRTPTLLTIGIQPSMSPDGESIAYVGPSTGPIPPNVNKIFRINTDGSDKLQLTKDSISGTRPIWSPDGKSIAFIGPNFYIMDKNGNGLTRLTESGGSQFSWSPNGKMIAYSAGSRNQIFLMNVDGSNTRRISNPDNFTFDPAVSWSPDGSKIAFSSGRNTIGPYTIYLADVEDGNQVTLIQNGVQGHGFSWSPDSSKIAFIASTGNSPGTSTSNLYIVNADGSNLMQLTNQYNFSTDPYWSPDGLKIVFSSFTDSKHSDLYVINVDGSGLSQLTTNLGICERPYCFQSSIP